MYSHVRMVDAPNWLPQRRTPRSQRGRARVKGLSYECRTQQAIAAAFNHYNLKFSLDSTHNFGLILAGPPENATVALYSAHNETPLLRCDKSTLNLGDINLQSSTNETTLNKIKENSGQVVTKPVILFNPWFQYQRNATDYFCSPDLLIIFYSQFYPTDHRGSDSTDHSHGNHSTGSGKVPPLLIIVCEIKLTYTPLAIKKLKSLYLPIISQFYQPIYILPLVICHYLSPTSPSSTSTLFPALNLPIPLLHFLGSGNLRL